MVVINIDTSKDSKEEIKQTIKYLQTLVDGETSTDSGFVNPFADTSASSTESDDTDGSPFGMFDNPLAEPETTEEDRDDASRLIADSDEDESVFSSEAEIVTEDDDDVYIEIVEYD